MRQKYHTLYERGKRLVFHFGYHDGEKYGQREKKHDFHHTDDERIYDVPVNFGIAENFRKVRHRPVGMRKRIQRIGITDEIDVILESD